MIEWSDWVSLSGGPYPMVCPTSGRPADERHQLCGQKCRSTVYRNLSGVTSGGFSGYPSQELSYSERDARSQNQT